MKFWIKLMLGIIMIISIILSVSRYIIVRKNFVNSLENSIQQNSSKHKLERYYLDSNIVSKIQQGEEFTEEHLYEYISSLTDYMNNDMESVEIYSEDKVKIISSFSKSHKLKLDNIDDLLDKEVDKYYKRN